LFHWDHIFINFENKLKAYGTIMKKYFFPFLVFIMGLLSFPAYSQAENQTVNDTTLLGLPGDNLDLYAVLDLFQKSKTIEDFEKSLNDEKTGINNLDLDLDNKVDFIKVLTTQKDQDFTLVLQVDVSKTEKQDVAVILVSKDKDKKVTMQIIGDKDLYGKDYIVEPKTSTTPPVTPNPAYQGNEPVTVAAPATTTTVVVESTPIVQYVYSPVYVPYYPPYYYGFYPPYFTAFAVMSVGIYCHNHAYYHGGYGYHGNTVVIHNTNNYNNYNNSRNSSNTVNHNNANGNYNRNNGSSRPSSGASASTRPSTGSSAAGRPSAGTSASTRPSTGSSASARPSTGTSASNRQSTGTSASTRQSSSNRSSSSASRSNYSSSSRSNYSSSSRSSSSRSGGYSGGGGSRGGGGGGRRR
jgi:hypothetical protein